MRGFAGGSECLLLDSTRHSIVSKRFGVRFERLLMNSTDISSGSVSIFHNELYSTKFNFSKANKEKLVFCTFLVLKSGRAIGMKLNCLQSHQLFDLRPKYQQSKFNPFLAEYSILTSFRILPKNAL